MKALQLTPKWGRLLAAGGLAALALMVLLVTLALAQTQIPPEGSAAFIQTSGPLTPLGVGDWYTNGGEGNHPHIFEIFVPCTIPQDTALIVELFDPELYPGTGAIDEIRAAGWVPGDPLTQDVADADDGLFELYDPGGALVQSTTYPPVGATEGVWVDFATFTTGDHGCGTYEVRVSTVGTPATGENDDNSWKLRINHPDLTPGSGDEPVVTAFETSFQHEAPADTATCQDFYFFVPVTPSIRLNNFDLDSGIPGYTPAPTLNYFQPDGSSPPGVTPSLSGNAVWNNGTASTRVGDVIDAPQTGWWHAEICVGPENQYIFEPEGLVYLLQQPDTPEMEVSKDDGLTVVAPGQIITYTIRYTNTGTAAAFNPTLADTLPASTTFVSCSGGLSCGEVAPGVVNYSLPLVPAPGGGQVFLTVQVDPAAQAGMLLTNTVTLNYEDVMGNHYPPKSAQDVDRVTELLCDLSITKVPSQQQVQPGDTVQYTLQVNNAGPDPAENVVVADSLPAQLTFVSTSGCDNDPSGVPTCSLGTIAAGASRTYTIQATVNSGVTGVVPNTARVSTDTPESNYNNNTAQAQIEVVPVQPPTPTPTRKKHEKEEEPATPTPVPPPPPAPTPLPPAPPVSLLPETGVTPVRTAPAWPFVIFPALGLLVGWAIYRGRNR
jgi:uncharacterized repeat protein (TIGR01451 family)